MKSVIFWQLKQRSKAVLLEESTPTSLIQRMVISIVAIIVIFIVWAALTPVKEKAKAFGQLVPEGNIQVIQHLEGGIISKILVQNDEAVKKNQILLELNPTAAREELAKTKAREVALLMDAERLQAYIQDIDPKHVAWGKSVIASQYNDVKKVGDIAAIIANEKVVLAQQIQQRHDQQAVVRAQYEQAVSALKQYQDDAVVLKQQVELFDRELNMFGKLRAKSYVSERDYLIAQRNANNALREYQNNSHVIAKQMEAIKEYRHRMQTVISNLNEAATQELDKINSQLTELHHSIVQLTDVANRTHIRAPISGIIIGLDLGQGSVISPGKTLMEIVPLDDNIMVEARISTRDIGHVSVGDPADIKVMAYDYARYGSITGRVISISASTFTTSSGYPYYRAMIALDRHDHKQFSSGLRPGMTVEANIITGQRSLLSYLIYPIRRTTNTTFGER